MKNIFKKIKNRLYRYKQQLNTKRMSDKEIESDRKKYQELNTDKRFIINPKYDYICKYDKYANNGGVIENSYFVQDIWGARKVTSNKPQIHYDVGSSVQGFVAHILGANVNVNLIDIRPMDNDFNTAFLQPKMGGGIKVYPS